MKQIITRVLTSPPVKKTLDFLKQNRRVVLVFLIGVIFIDTFFIKTVSDVMSFGVLLFYGICIKTYRLKSRETFLLCLGLLGAMFTSFLTSGTSVPTEKAAVWLVLFMALGIYQKWREISGSEKKENYSSD